MTLLATGPSARKCGRPRKYDQEQGSVTNTCPLYKKKLIPNQFGSHIVYIASCIPAEITTNSSGRQQRPSFGTAAQGLEPVKIPPQERRPISWLQVFS